MTASPGKPSSPLDPFFSEFGADIAADAVRPLAEYLARFPGDDAAIAEAWIAHTRGVSAPPSADRIAHYRILHQIGRGGQATVYLAEDTRLHRQVALKVLETGVATDRTVFDRFQREAEITSRLDHPCICPIYETGEDRGVLWIAMRHVDGVSLAEKISAARQQATSDGSFVDLAEMPHSRVEDAAPPGSGTPSSVPTTWAEISRVIALFEETARALHVAHEHGVIHRDIKPGNIMVTKDGHPVVLDFGLAQDVGGSQPTLTLTGNLMGTPAYMSPEQITAHRIRLDRRTDVYSLGVSLYECITLQRPFDAPTRDGLYKQILTKNPPDARRLNPGVPGDLALVLETALEKDTDHRYQTALAFADDLERVRTFQPIRARPVGLIVRLRRWSQRNPALAVATFALFMALATGLAISLALLHERDQESSAKSVALAEVKSERDAKELSLHRAEGLRLLASSANVLGEDPALALLLALEGAESLPGHQANTAAVKALEGLQGTRLLLKGADPAEAALISDDGGTVVTITNDVVRVYDAEGGTELSHWTVPEIIPGRVEFGDAEGKTLVTLSRDNVVRLWSSAGGPPRRVIALAEEERGGYLDVNAQGTRLLVTVYPQPGKKKDASAILHDCTTGNVLARMEVRTASLGPRFCSDGRWIAFMKSTGPVLVDAETGAERPELDGFEEITESAFSPDSRWVLGVERSGTIRVWKLDDGKPVARIEVAGQRVSDPFFSGDATRVAAYGSDSHIHVWDTAHWQPVRSILLPERPFTKQLNSSGSLLLVGVQGRAETYDVGSGRRLASLNHLRGGNTATFTKDGRRILAVSQARHLLGRAASVTIVEAAPPDELPGGGGRQIVRFSRDLHRVLTCAHNPVPRVWDTRRQRIIASLEGSRSPVVSADISEDGRVAVAAAGTTALLWDAGSGKSLGSIEGHSATVTSVAFLDSERVITASEDRTVRIWSRVGRNQLASFDHPTCVDRVVVNPKGRVYAAIGDDGSVIAREGASSKPTVSLPALGIPTAKPDPSSIEAMLRMPLSDLRRVCFTESGRYMVVGTRKWTGVEPSVNAWDISTGAALAVCGTGFSLESVSGDRLLASKAGEPLTTWDLKSGTRLAEFRQLQNATPLFAAALSGGRVAAIAEASEEDGERWESIRIWDAASGSVIASVRVPGVAMAIHLVGDRHLLVFGNSDIRLFDVTTGLQPYTIANPSRGFSPGTSVEASPDGQFLILASPSAVRSYPLDPVACARATKPRPFTVAELDHFEIGTLAARTRARAILGAVKFGAEIVRDLDAEDSLGTTVREAAVAQARASPDGPDQWSEVARRAAMKSNASNETLLAALRLAEAAFRNDPNAKSLEALGAVRYRLGDFAGAHEALSRWEQASAGDDALQRVVGRIFMAMTRHRLGHEEQAKADLAEARKELSRGETFPLFSEAEALLEANPGADSRPR